MSTMQNSSSPLFDYAAMVWRRKFLVLTVMFALTVPAVVVSLNETPVYQASTSLALTKPSVTSDGSATTTSLSDTEMRTQSALVTGDEVTALARERGAQTSVTTTLTGSSNILVINAGASDPVAAAQAANTWAQAYLEVRQRQQQAVSAAGDRQLADRIADLQLQLVTAEPSTSTVLQSQLGTLQTQQYRSELQKSVAANNATIVSSAVPPAAPVSPLPIRDGLLAAVLGLTLGIVAAILLEMSRSRAAARSLQAPAADGEPAARTATPRNEQADQSAENAATDTIRFRPRQQSSQAR